MTKIIIDQNLIMQQGLAFASSQQYERALSYFVKADSYEARLNELGCLAMLGESLMVMENYRALVCKYLVTHNLIDDIAYLGDQVMQLLHIADRYFLKLPVFDENKISADKSLLIDYGGGIFMDDFMDQLQEELDFGELKEAPKATPFFDVKSPRYPYQLRQAMVEAGRNSKLSKKYAKQLLQLDCEDTDILQTQLSLCIYLETYRKGVKFAEKLVDREDISVEAICCAVELLAHKSCNAKQLLYVYLNKAKDILAEVDLSDLQDFVLIANNRFGDYSLGEVFANALYNDEMRNSLSLRICAYAFHNVGNFKMAKQCCTKLLSCLPFDTFSQMMLKRLADKEKCQPLKIPNKHMLYLQLPESFVNLAHDHLMLRDEKDLVIRAEDYLYLSALVEQSKYYGMMEEFEKFAKYTSSARIVLDLFVPEDKQTFEAFAIRQIGMMYPEPSLVGVYDGMVALLLAIGYRKPLVLRARDNSIHVVDFSHLEEMDSLFYQALAICATLYPVNVLRCQRVYLDLLALDVTLPKGILGIRQVAYYLLKTSAKRSVIEPLEELFVDGDKQLYQNLRG